MCRQHHHRMVVRKLSLGLLLCHFIIAGVCSDCVPVQCLQCDSTNVYCSLSCIQQKEISCITDANVLECRKEFWVNISSSILKPNEGDDVTLTCVSNLPNTNLTFVWMKDGEVQDQNQSVLVLHRVLSYNSGLYNCSVNSLCGNYSDQYRLTVANQNVIILLVCGVAALGLVLIMGLAMKIKLKRDRAKHRERRKQREETGQSGGLAPFTPRHS